MGQSVAPEITIATENFVTQHTGKWLLLGVSQQVSLKVGPLTEYFPTGWTLMIRIVNVKYPMNCQGAGLAESFATILALERLLFGMDVSMIAEVILTTEGLSANITIERTFVRMSAFVNQQVVRLCKLTVAVLTYVLLFATTSFPLWLVFWSSCLLSG